MALVQIVGPLPELFRVVLVRACELRSGGLFVLVCASICEIAELFELLESILERLAATEIVECFLGGVDLNLH